MYLRDTYLSECTLCNFFIIFLKTYRFKRHCHYVDKLGVFCLAGAIGDG